MKRKESPRLQAGEYVKALKAFLKGDRPHRTTGTTDISKIRHRPNPSIARQRFSWLRCTPSASPKITRHGRSSRRAEVLAPSARSPALYPCLVSGGRDSRAARYNELRKCRENSSANWLLPPTTGVDRPVGNCRKSPVSKVEREDVKKQASFGEKKLKSGDGRLLTLKRSNPALSTQRSL